MKPNSIQVEMVEGCSRICEFCGGQSIWKTAKDRKLKFMNVEFANFLAEDIGNHFPKRRIEFAMHGEPTLHPQASQIVSAFRHYNRETQLQLTTNGAAILAHGKDYISSLFSSGLNILLVDMYDHIEKLKSICKNSGFPVYDYYKCDINPYHNNGPKNKLIILMGDLGAMTGVKKARKILNHAGNVPAEIVLKYNGKVEQLPLAKKCSRVFREIAIHYDGTIPICCMDWKHEFIVGDLKVEGSIFKIWESETFDNVRYFLNKGQRIFRPCYKCDYNGGFRLGLLPKVESRDDSTTKKQIKSHLTVFSGYSRCSDPFIKERRSFWVS